MTYKPTDQELDALRQADNGELNFVTLRQFRVIARAALAKWGTPPAVAGEPVAWRLRDEEASSTYRKDVYVYYDRADFKENINPIEICDGLECLYSPSQITQPTQAQAGAVESAEFGQFLSDVLTAAGLVTHGKQCKALGERLADMCVKLRHHGSKGGQHE